MSKRALWVAVVVLLLLGAASMGMRGARALLTKQSDAGSAAGGAQLDFGAQLDARLPVLMKTYQIPGAVVALLQQGQLVWYNAYGYAELENGREMTTDDYCRVESISKSVTAWGVMKLVQQGQIALDTPVQAYIKSWAFPESPFSSEAITVRRLLSHSAGLPLGTIGIRYDPRGEVPSLRESLSKDALLFQEPGLSFSYSNAGFNVLELLIEEVSGRDFSEYMRQEVLLPLGMDHASYTWSSAFDPPVPNGYDVEGHAIPAYVYPDKAAGGLFARVKDIAAFVSAGMPGFSPRGLAVLDSGHIQQLYQPAVQISDFYGLAFDAYGLGYLLEELTDGRQAVAHGGQGSGWMTHFHAIPETGDGIIILVNSQRAWPFFAHVLNDWASWLGIGPIGMAVILKATRLLWILILLIALLSGWQCWRLWRGLSSGKRRFAPFSRSFWLGRLAQGGLLLAIVVALLWFAHQEYSFITAVFPVASFWLGRALLFSAAALLGSVLFPAAGQAHGS